ncbi:hypothetical protein B0I35DRAFT_415041 [Stachybotrys elegans]|uniref:BZIP domain-containing protein n=1 Tax=Stachybotrys elegans TaxID=80388 RepID=A0A8K0SDQ2_9HYPO|nr:hypothetical protein B0I35DRAFT_415041 [Stachybotrys elegans]
MTPAQLQQRRMKDREYQRAKRERIRNRIKTLEACIEDLKSSTSLQSLQALRRRNDELEVEVAVLTLFLSLVAPYSASSHPLYPRWQSRPPASDMTSHPVPYPRLSSRTPGDSTSITAPWHGAPRSAMSEHSSIGGGSCGENFELEGARGMEMPVGTLDGGQAVELGGQGVSSGVVLPASRNRDVLSAVTVRKS